MEINSQDFRPILKAGLSFILIPYFHWAMNGLQLHMSLYHLMFDQEVLMREGLLFDTERETKAGLFAAEFLMPEEGGQEFVYKRLPSRLEEKHIIRIQQHFKVVIAQCSVD